MKKKNKKDVHGDNGAHGEHDDNGDVRSEHDNECKNCKAYEELKNQHEELNGKYLRAIADYQNLEKRLQNTVNW